MQKAIGTAFLALLLIWGVPSSAAKSVRQKALDSYWQAITPNMKPDERPTLGIELEGLYPGTYRQDAFNNLVNLIDTQIGPLLYPDAEIHKEYYNYNTRRGEPRKGMKFWFAGAPEGEIWHFKEDGSIQAPRWFYGIEFVTPILHVRKDLQRYYDINDILQKSGFQEEPGSAALQVHVGFSPVGPLKTALAEALTPDVKANIEAQVAILILFFSKIEKEMMQIFEVNPTRQKFTMPTPTSAVEHVWEGFDSFQAVGLSDFLDKHYTYRYWALNLHALYQFGTVEVRFANSATDLDDAEALVEFSSKIITAIRTKDPRIQQLLTKHLDENIPVSELIKTFEMTDLEHFIKRKSATSCSEVLGAVKVDKKRVSKKMKAKK